MENLSYRFEKAFMEELAKVYLDCKKHFKEAYMLIKPMATEKDLKEAVKKYSKHPMFLSIVKDEENRRLAEYRVEKGQVIYTIAQIVQESYNDGDRPNALKGCDMLAKITGAYQPEVQINNINISGERMSEIQSVLFGAGTSAVTAEATSMLPDKTNGSGGGSEKDILSSVDSAEQTEE